MSDDVSPDILSPLLPFRESLVSSLEHSWEYIVAGVVQAPDPRLAAANLSRVLEQGFGSGTGAVLGAADLCQDLLFILGASPHLTTTLLNQGQNWESVFLSDRHAKEKSTPVHLEEIRRECPLDLPEDDFLRQLRAYRNREYLRIGTRDLLAHASLEETTRDLSALADAAVQIAYEYTRARLQKDYGEAVVERGLEDTRPVEFVVFGMGKLGGGRT